MISKREERPAIMGGPKVRTITFPSQDTIGPLEQDSVIRALTGRLSGYQGNWSNHFYGGPFIQELEQKWRGYFRVKNAIPCNSATSGLQIALGAIGIRPGDEVIVSPYSMTCSATAPLVWSGIPVFADIEPGQYCLDPVSVRSRITEKTKAIIVVDLFGQSHDVEAFNAISRKFGIPVIVDSAQALGAKFPLSGPLNLPDRPEKSGHWRYHAGTGSTIGVYSFNFGKHITSGEGGMIVTEDEGLAFRCRLLMNHAEAVIHDMRIPVPPIARSAPQDMWGFNMRMTELSAALLIPQLDRLGLLLQRRLNNVAYLESLIQGNGLPIAFPRPRAEGYSHVFYVHPMEWEREKAEGLNRELFVDAVKAELSPLENRLDEGVPMGYGYITPIYLMPIFQKKVQADPRNVSYFPGSCPVCEETWANRLFLHRFIGPTAEGIGQTHIEDVALAFRKVWKHREALIKWDRSLYSEQRKSSHDGGPREKTS